jgi:hypothetical protein
VNPPPANRWRFLRRGLVGGAVCLTLICLFYTEENWRGRRALEECKRDLARRGINLDWAQCIPAPVPTDQNFFGVPQMQRWFVGRGSDGWNDLSRKLSAPFYPGSTIDSNTPRLLVAEVTIGLPEAATPDGVVALRWDDPAAPAKAAALLTNAIGPTARAPRSEMGIGLMLRRPEEVQPARIFLQCQAAPTEKELEEFLPDSILRADPGLPERVLKFEPNGEGAYRVTMPVLATVADCLSWSDGLAPQCALIRQAMQRPYARMQGSYERPENVPIPNFQSMRSLAQGLGARAQCHFLLGQPEEALRDLTFINDVCRPVLEENQPMTLVSAMIDGAVRGLYASQIADGLRLQAWREPQLTVLEEQLKSANVLAQLQRSFQHEPQGDCRLLETTPATPLLRLFRQGYPGVKIDRWTGLKVSVQGALLPRGWIYQNSVTLAELFADIRGLADPANQLVFTEKIEDFAKRANAISPWAPYSCLVSLFTPNVLKAFQTSAHNQTLVNQALIACALERFHLAHGQYPETLAALCPQFLTEIPHDIIGGQPPHYRRAADGTFVLYSIGWSGRDGGGVRGKSNAEGDWVWPD